MRNDPEYQLKWSDALEGSLWQCDGKIADGKSGLFDLVQETLEEYQISGERDFYFRITDNCFGEISYYFGPFSLTELGRFRVEDAYQRRAKLDYTVLEEIKLFGIRTLSIYSTLKGYSPQHRFSSRSINLICTRTGNWKRELDKLKLD